MPAGARGGRGSRRARGSERGAATNLRAREAAQLVRLLHEPELALGEGDLPVPLVGDPLDRDLLAPHPAML